MKFSRVKARSVLRLSVRGLMILVLVVGGGLGWMLQRARLERKAAAAILKAGGTVGYDWEVKDGRPVPNGEPWAPAWLVQLVGVGHVRYAVSVVFDERGSDAEMAQAGNLTRLRELIFSRSRVTDAGLAHLEGMSRLEGLCLPGNPRVTDAGLAHLKGLTRLRFLMLDGTAIGDSGLANLKGLRDLTVLSLDHTEVGDAGLAHLKALTRLERLTLNDTRVSDAGLIHLASQPRLEDLSLDRTRVTDAGLVHLAGMTGLHSLALTDVQLTDAALASLKTLTGLTSLSLSGTKLSEDDVEELQEALPRARIQH